MSKWINYTFAEYLKEVRKNKKLTMIDLQKATGISQSYLSQLENGKSLPSDKIIKKLSKGLASNDEESHVLEKEMNDRILAEENNKIFEQLEKSSGNNRFIVQISNLSKTINDLEIQLKASKKNVNLNNVFSYREKLTSENESNSIVIKLDNKQLSDSEIQSLETLLLGIQEKRKKD
ncbi:helix-turn-helix domain-containing protein [Desemzia sp. C1]|uniref:helix-turn-helix domain-containing protein n=1 Tax=Desemzia sp. C1 TaxID=2892016 RepID=UPI001E518C35|nr:helix-turn-helix transcriptional regulator [Desemzia sp. C1]MCI3028551.1 helix-turn-helix domain-containing protein [Desemzia sp. C1]